MTVRALRRRVDKIDPPTVTCDPADCPKPHRFLVRENWVKGHRCRTCGGFHPLRLVFTVHQPGANR